ncbi:MAG: hypothetical protein WCS86_02550 [Candidatus Paceibacterota bacterium]
MKETFYNDDGHGGDFNKKEVVDTFNFNEDIVTEPKEGDLALCAKTGERNSKNEYEWALLPMQSQFEKEHRVVLFFGKEESDDFIKKAVRFLVKNYPKMEPGVFKIDMDAYKYFKEESEFSDVLFVKVTPENFHERNVITGFEDLNFGKENI